MAKICRTCKFWTPNEYDPTVGGCRVWEIEHREVPTSFTPRYREKKDAVLGQFRPPDTFGCREHKEK